jgi:hypothetical protein
MAYTSNKKINGLDSAVTPLGAGNEIVLSQAGNTVKTNLASVEAKIFDAKAATTSPTGSEVVVVRQIDNNLRQVALSDIVPALNITNAKVSASANIVDTKLATIATAGKVSNSATTATSANTINAIVARDASGNFTAGTVTAALTGNASTATTLATGRTIALTGDVTGTTGSFNGSANVSAATTIANNAVTTAKITDSNVTTAKIADSNVTTAKIADSNVTTAKIADANVTTAKIAADAVDNTKLRNSAALSVIGRSANSSGDPADIAAATDGHVLRRSGTTLEFGQIATGGITNASVTSEKLSSSIQINSLGVGTAASGTTGEIRATNNITAYFSSDRRLKQNIRFIPNALEKINALSGVTYDWTDKYIQQHGGEDGYFMRKHDVGVIAQQVQKVLPQLVATQNDGFLAVKYERLCALLIEGVKELCERVTELEKR